MGTFNQLTLLMTEETPRSHKLRLAPPCARSIVNEFNKVWLDGATTSEPRHLTRRSEPCRCSFGKPMDARPGLLGFEIKATATDGGARTMRPIGLTVHRTWARSKRETVRIVV